MIYAKNEILGNIKCLLMPGCLLGVLKSFLQEGRIVSMHLEVKKIYYKHLHLVSFSFSSKKITKQNHALNSI